MKASTRKKLPSSAFAYPKQRLYPIDTKKRARAALRFAGKKSTRGSYSHVAKKVRAKYGNAIRTKKGKK